MKDKVEIDNLDELNDGLLPPAPEMSEQEWWAFKSRHQDNLLLNKLNSESFTCCWSYNEAYAILWALENDAGLTPFECCEWIQPYIVQPFAPGPLKLLEPASILIRQIKERGKKCYS